MISLVTLDEVNFRLRLDLAHDGEEFTDERAEHFEKMMVDATGIILDYLKMPEEEWDQETVPAPVSAAIILVVRNIYDGADEPLSEPVKNLVHRFRDPALA